MSKFDDYDFETKAVLIMIGILFVPVAAFILRFAWLILTKGEL